MRLAMPYMDLVSFSEMADAVESCIAAAPDVLWLADGDTGHGNVLAVQKLIHAYARRGAAAVLIEDKIWPRPLGRQGAKLVVERVPRALISSFSTRRNRKRRCAHRAMRHALSGLKGGAKPRMATPAELATAIWIDEYPSRDSRWPDPS
jgi:hypothetical protein